MFNIRTSFNFLYCVQERAPCTKERPVRLNGSNTHQVATGVNTMNFSPLVSKEVENRKQKLKNVENIKKVCKILNQLEKN